MPMKPRNPNMAISVPYNSRSDNCGREKEVGEVPGGPGRGIAL